MRKVSTYRIEQSQGKEKVVCYMKKCTSNGLNLLAEKFDMTRSELINGISILYLDKMKYPLVSIDENYIGEINNLRRVMTPCK